MKIAPKGIIYSLLASATVGFIFIVSLAIAIPDIKSVTESTYPIAAIASYYLGDTLVKVFLVFVLIAMFACTMVVMTCGSRLLFAMARDEQFLASRFFQKISAHRVPQNGIWLGAAVAIFFILIADSATSLYGAITVLAALVYLVTVISFAANIRKLPSTTTFTLGRWHWPVVILAVVWLVTEIGILTIPEEFHSVALATAGVLISGAVVFALTRFKRLR